MISKISNKELAFGVGFFYSLITFILYLFIPNIFAIQSKFIPNILMKIIACCSILGLPIFFFQALSPIYFCKRCSKELTERLNKKISITNIKKILDIFSSKDFVRLLEISSTDVDGNFGQISLYYCKGCKNKILDIEIIDEKDKISEERKLIYSSLIDDDDFDKILGKFILSSINDPSQFVGHNIYDVKSKKFIGKLKEVKVNDDECKIQGIFGDIFQKKLHDVYIIYKFEPSLNVGEQHNI